jgi:hypothetical protein
MAVFDSVGLSRVWIVSTPFPLSGKTCPKSL